MSANIMSVIKSVLLASSLMQLFSIDLKIKAIPTESRNLDSIFIFE